MSNRESLRTALSELRNRYFWYGVSSLVLMFGAWEIGSRSEQWFGFSTPSLGALPPPDLILSTLFHMIGTLDFWQNVWLSCVRVFVGFTAAVVLGVPFGLLLALNRFFHGVFFPPFEVFRPIPPIAWVPASIIFWPTQFLSIGFVTFLGAFFAIVISVIGGVRLIDVRYVQVARSMGSSRLDIFRRVIIPGALPSIIVGAVIGIGITWQVVIAAELISGGGSAVGSSGGLGSFIWNAYVTGGPEAETHIIIGMLSIGVVGSLSSELLRAAGKWVTPWLNST
jgi:NitT/TauT family transport system permease protein